MSIVRRSLLVFSLVCLLHCLPLHNVTAQDALTIRQDDDAVKIEKLLKTGRYSILTKAEYARLAEKQVDRALPAIRAATFSAELQNDSLVGSLNVVFQDSADPGNLVQCAPFGPDRFSLEWDNGESVTIGTNQSSQLAILRDQNTALVGDWAVKGTKNSKSLTFELGFFPTAANKLVLELPNEWSVVCADSLIKQPKADSTSTSTIWTIYPGNDFRTTLQIVQDDSPAESVTYIQQKVNSLQVDRDMITFGAEFTLNVLPAPVEQLTLQVPSSLVVDSVRYGELALSFELEADSKDEQIRHVQLRLPEPLRGLSRKLTLRGFAKTVTGKESELPYAELLVAGSQTVLLNGETTVRVDPPVNIDSITPIGMRQTDAVFLPGGQTTFTYRQTRTDDRIRAKLSEPEAEFEAEFADRIVFGGSDTQFTSRVRLSATEQQVWTTQFSIAAGWDITEVRLGLTGKAVNSRVDIADDGTCTLTVGFPAPIQSSSAQILTISGGRLPDVAGRKIRLPVIHIQNAEKLRRTIRVVHAAESIPLLQDSNGFSRIARDELSGFAVTALAAIEDSDRAFDGTADNSSESRNRTVNEYFLIADGSTATASLRPSVSRKRISVNVHNTVKVDDAELMEELVIEVDPRDQTLKKLRVRTNDTNWQPAFFLREKPVLGTSVAAGLTEIELPSITDRFQLLCRRVRGIGNTPMSLSLLTVSDATQFSGSVHVSPSVSELFSILPGDHISETVPSSDDRDRVLRYSDEATSLRLQKLTRGISAVARLSLDSTFTNGADEPDCHEASWLIRGPATSFRFRMPAGTRLLAAEVNGQPLPPRAGAGGLNSVLPLAANSESNRVRLKYHVARKEVFFEVDSRRSVGLPRTNVDCDEFSWSLKMLDGLSIVQTTPLTTAASETVPGRFLDSFAADPQQDKTAALIKMKSVPAHVAVTMRNKNTARCLQWAIFISALLLSGIFRNRVSRRPALFVLACLFVLVLAWPESQLGFVNGAFWGWLIGFCIPSALLQKPKTGAQRLPKTVVQTATFLVLISASNSVFGQSNVLADQNLPQIFVPQDSPVVYLQDTILADWRARAAQSGDDVLIQNVVYLVDVDEDNFTRVRVQMKVVLPASGRGELRVPFANANPVTCVLDGRQVQFRRNLNDIIVDFKDRADRKPDIPAVASLVEFELRPQSGLSNAGYFSTDLPLKNCHQARLRLTFAVAQKQVTFSCDDRQISGSGRKFSLDASRAKKCAVRWTQQESQQPDVPVTQLIQDCAVVIHPTFFDAHIRQEFIDWPVQKSMSWMTPENSLLSNLKLSGLVRVGQPGRGESGSGVLEPAGRMVYLKRVAGTDRAIIISHVRIPREKNSTKIPAIRLQAADSSVEYSSYRVAIAPAAGFEIGAVNSRTLLQVPADSIPGDLMTSSGISQPLVFAANQPHALSAELNPRIPRQYVAVKQAGRIQGNHTDWQFDIQIETDGILPVFEHEVLVSPDMEVSNVELQAGQADRLGRWTREENRLRIFLNGPTGDDRSIRINARIPHRKNTAQIPTIRLPGTFDQPARLSLTHTPDIRVKLTGLAFVSSAANAVSDLKVANDVTLGEFTKQSSIEPNMQVFPRAKIQAGLHYMLFRNQESGRLRAVVAITCHDPEASGQSVRCRIPAALSGYTYSAQRCEFLDTDDDTAMAIQPLEDTRNFRIDLETDVDEAQLLQFGIELPDVSGHVELLPAYLSLESDFEPLAEFESTERVLPERFQQLSSGSEINSWQATFPARIQRSQSDRSAAPEYAVANHLIEIDGPVAKATSTLVVANNVLTGTQEFAWPSQYEITSVRLNSDHTPEFRKTDAGQLEVRNSTGEPLLLLSVEWRYSHAIRPLYNWRIPLPFAGLNCNHTFVRLASEQQVRLVSGRNLQLAASTEASVRLQETLLELWRRTGIVQYAEFFLAVHQGQAVAATESPRESRLSRGREEIQTQLVDSVPARNLFALPESAGWYEFGSLSSRSDGYSVTCLTYPHVIERLSLALIGLPFVLWGLIRLTSVEWYRRNRFWLDSVPICVIGLAWLFLLTPWVIGAVLVLSGVFAVPVWKLR